HSYYVNPTDVNVIAGKTNYGFDFVSMVWRDNIFATQFHPEKSQKIGIEMLRGFKEYCEKS
ncbi:MAG: imidazole glycerol phosphate synthase subunit HisH, partial [Thermodesulfovibrionales bacterium]|nr:imidazole glycerol phosphate synthase subunit HisH [Thermodesulfovibrionales bacterium]